jgi:hypothetical protein
MPGSNVRVFVSSVVDGFEAFREAARRGIERAGADAVLVNEDLPAMGESSRNACLDAVESCDAYLMLLGARGGWTTPAAKLVVEEEYEHARRQKMPTLIFVQQVTRDSDAERLLRVVSDYTDGVFRQSFQSAADLERQVEAAVRLVANRMMQPITPPSTVTERLSKRARNRNDAVLRVVLAPERREEVITPMDIESRQFTIRLYEIGHVGDHPIFNYSRPKSDRLEGSARVIEQSDPNGRHDGTETVLLSIDEQGILEVEANVTNRRPGMGFASGMVIVADDVSSVLTAIFGFAARLFDRLDPHKRHQRFLYGASLLELGFRQITRDATPKSSYGIAMSRSDGPLSAFKEPRILSREDLAAPDAEITRTVTMLERAARG